MGAHIGSLDEIVNNPLELDLLQDFPWVLGVKLGPKSPSHSCSGLKLSVLENYEGGSLSRERRITSKAEFLAWRGCHLGQTLPKALRTQGLTALTSNFGLVGLV